MLGGSLANISTGIYPEFATDMQSQTMAMLANASGTYQITENLFESRFKHVAELNKMGANIVVNQNIATVCGKTNCYVGTNVCASDLRGGAALVLAGLAATGTTVINEAEYIFRGYENIDKKLTYLGAEIHKED